MLFDARGILYTQIANCLHKPTILRPQIQSPWSSDTFNSKLKSTFNFWDYGSYENTF